MISMMAAKGGKKAADAAELEVLESEMGNLVVQGGGAGGGGGSGGAMARIGTPLLVRMLERVGSMYHVMMAAQTCKKWNAACRDNQKSLLYCLSLALFPDVHDREIQHLLKDDSVAASVRRIDFSGCRDLTDTAINEVTLRCGGGLTHISLRGCKSLSDQSLCMLLHSNSRTLVSLDLSDIPSVCDTVFYGLGGGESGGGGAALRSLRVKGCSLLTDQAMSIVAMRCSSITALNLSGCKDVSDGAVGYAIGANTSLKELHLVGTQAAECSLYTLARSPGASNLTALDLSSCKFVNDGLTVPLVQACTSLRAIALSGNLNVTDETVARLPHSVRHLLIDRCPGVTDRSVVSAASRCTELRELDLRGNVSVTDTGLQALITHATCLERLDIRGCPVSGALTGKLKELVGPIVGSAEKQD